jgi:hypothetical protein
MDFMIISLTPFRPLNNAARVTRQFESLDCEKGRR